MLSFLKNLLKPVDTTTATYTCPRCSDAMSAPIGEPVYCSPCDKTFLTHSEYTESMPLTLESHLTGESYLGKPKDSPPHT